MLSDGTIREIIKKGYVKIEVPEGFSIEDWQYQPASFEMRLGKKFVRRARMGDFPIELEWGGSLVMPPGACYLATTVEKLILPDGLVARVEGKSTLGRNFIQVHSTAGFIDPGFPGEITLEIKNEGEQQYTIHPGDRICQVSFDWTDFPVLRPYGHPELNSHYVGQTGPTLPHKEALQ